MAAAALLLGAATATAQLPRTISFQGLVSGIDGTPAVDGQHTLVLSIYESQGATTPLFSETHTVQTTRGVFDAVIGESGGIPVEIPFDAPYWLGVAVDGAAELSPRIPFTAVPYALRAITAENAARAAVADNAVAADRAVVADSLDGGVVSAINGEKGGVRIVGAGATTVTSSDGVITISGAGGGVASIANSDQSLAFEPPYGPNINAYVRDGGIQTWHLRDLSVTPAKITTGSPPAASGMALMSTGSPMPTWGYPTASDIVLPFYKALTSTSPVFTIQNMGAGTTARFSTHDGGSLSPTLDVLTWGKAPAAQFTANGITPGSNSVVGITNHSPQTASFGLISTSDAGSGVQGVGPINGVKGSTTAHGAGVLGSTSDARWYSGDVGVLGTSRNGRGVIAISESSSALEAMNVGNGGSAASIFTQGDAGNTWPALRVANFSAGGAAIFDVVGGSNDADVLAASTNGLGTVGRFTVDNPSNGADALKASTSGSGAAIVGSTSPYEYFMHERVGVYGDSYESFGVFGASMDYPAVLGAALGSSSQAFGVAGVHVDGYTFGALGTDHAGLYAIGDRANGRLGGLFDGDVEINGDLHVNGDLSKSSGTFRIDHPLDPTNRYLYHSFVESPEMLNVYSGTIVLDASGEAVVTLPDWFEALNVDYRYQLTCVGGYAPVYVAREVSGNTFAIAGGRPGLKVSWQVSGVRNDPYARKHPVVVEVDKPAEQRGTYLNPDAYGVAPTTHPMPIRLERNAQPSASTKATGPSDVKPAELIPMPAQRGDAK
jgi:hypothetical protein